MPKILNYEKAQEIAKRSFSLKFVGFMTRDSSGEKSYNIDSNDYQDGSYNSNNGVLVFKTPDGVFALPETNENAEELETSGFVKDENIGVPSLNSGELGQLLMVMREKNGKNSQQEDNFIHR